MQRGTPTLGLHATTDIGNVRKTNEDTYVLAPNLLTRENDVAASRSLVAVFDGHGGRRAAEYLETHCVRVFTESEAYGCDTQAALTATCQRLDAAFLALAADGGSFNDGATAIIVVVEQRHDASVVVTTANVGDSRALLCHVKQPPFALSVDQTAARDDEASRVYAAGGFVAYKNKFRPHIATLSGVKRRLRGTKEAWMRSFGRPLRVYPGGVMCSRSIGDLNCKQANVLISDPEVTQLELSTDHICIVVASDGLWGVASNRKVQAKVRACLEVTATENAADRAAYISKTLTKVAKGALESDDNITVATIVIDWTSTWADQSQRPSANRP